MPLTPAQLTTLKTHILANTDPLVVTARNNGDAGAIAVEYNKDAVPDHTVWRTSLSRAEVRKNTTWTEFIGRSQGERDGYRVLIEDGVVDPSDANIRQGFNDIFSGASGVNSRTALTAASKRLCSLVEKIFATGTGSNASPATMAYEGPISYQEIAAALNS